jgi:hypothetical protein
VPLEHIQSLRSADEEVLKEIERFKQALEKVGSDNEESYVFMETAVDFHRHKHTYIDCVPMEKELAFDAPMYFSKVRVVVAVGGWPVAPPSTAQASRSGRGCNPLSPAPPVRAGHGRNGGLDPEQEPD